MTRDEISQAIDRAFAAYSAGDLDGFVADFAPDMVYADNSRPALLHGRDAFKAYAAGWLDASSDGRIVPVRKVIEDGEAVAELRFEATHDRGPMYGVEQTGTRFAFNFAILASFADGRLTRLKAFYNPLSVMQALGVVGELPTSPR
jgi:ketosteroid isomerase-like protein